MICRHLSSIVCRRVTHQEEVSDNEDAERNTIPAECLEVVRLDIGEQELDREDGDKERRDHADDHDDDFRTRKVQPEFHDLRT